MAEERLINEFQREILPDDVNELINLFANRFVNIDKSYRKFYYHYDKLDDTDRGSGGFGSTGKN